MSIICYDCFREYDAGLRICPHCGYAADADRREPNHLPAGTVLQARYVIGRVCGYGGFGVTYKAFDRQLETPVAIKEYFPNGTVNRIPGTTEAVLFGGKRLREYEYGKQRFLDEARITARYVSHKNIVNVFDYFEANKTAYIVMEFLDGIDLEKYLETSTGGTERVSPAQAVDIALSICNALKTIHKDNILHRDISPDNIYLCLNHTIKLYDFGAARFSADKDKLLTVILKPGYAPVEQYVEQDTKVNNQGAWTDIYALGATLYKMVTGVKPVESMNRKIKDELVEPIALVPDIPQYLNDAIMRAMAVEPHLRFQTVDEFAAVLQQKKQVVSLKKTIRRKKRARLVGIAAAAAAVAVGFVFFAKRWNTQKDDNTLPAASIKVWYIGGDAEKQALESIRDEFCSSFDGVEIELQGFPAEIYRMQLQTAESIGMLPTVYQSDGVDTAQMDAAPLDAVLEKLDLGAYWYLDDVRQEMLAQKKLPVGYDLPVFYLNHTLCDYDGERVAKLADVFGESGTISVADAYAKEFAALFDEPQFMRRSINDFCSGNSKLLFSHITDYYTVRNALPGQYRLLAVDVKDAAVRLGHCWSWRDTGEPDAAKVAQRFLEYLLSDNAQDYLFVRNETPGLPVNKNALAVYTDVYRSDMQPLLARPSAYEAKLE